MEPQIRFCTSGGGVRIAYATLGVGPPLVLLLGWGTSFEAEWKDPEGRAWWERLAEGRSLVRCERRGCGASQRDVSDVSLDAHVGDLAAVTDHLGLGHFDLFGAYDAAGAAAAYAARYAHQVSRLVLWAPFARGGDIQGSDASDALAQLWANNPQLARRSWAGLGFPTGPAERARWYSNMLKESFTPAVAVGYTNFVRDLDVAGELQQIEAPTLVLHRDRDRLVPHSASRAVASLIPNATLMSLPGDEGYPPFGDPAYLQDLNRFLDQDRAAGLSTAVPSGTAVILFADIADSTALTERIGDSAFREKARTLDDALRTCVRNQGGAVIDAKTLGDGILATFPGASQAIAAALDCASAGEAQGLPLHLGIHAGDVIRESDNVFGGAVNVAARISALSPPGEVLVSDILRGLARTSAGVTFEDRGEQELKGVAEPVRVFAVRKAGE